MHILPSFTLVYSWDQTKDPALRRFAITAPMGVGHGERLWTFNWKDLRAVEALLGTPLTYDGGPSPPPEAVDTYPSKGKSGLEIMEYPTTYLLREWQRPKHGTQAKPREYLVPKSLVDDLWETIWRPRPLYQEYGFDATAEAICRHFGAKRFFRPNPNCYRCKDLLGPCDACWQEKRVSFDGAKFSGGKNRRQGLYFSHMYYPSRIMESRGAIWFGAHSSKRLLDHIPTQLALMETHYE